MSWKYRVILGNKSNDISYLLRMNSGTNTHCNKTVNGI